MRVAFYCISLRGGGTEHVVSTFANDLASTGYSVAIVTLTACTPFYQLKPNVKVLCPSEKKLANTSTRISQMKHAWRETREFRPDIALVFGEDIISGIIPLIKIAGVKKSLVFLRGNPARSLTKFNGFANPKVSRLADAIIVQTRRARQALSKKYRSSRIFVLPNPVDIPSSLIPLTQRSKRVLCVASLGRNKNQAALLRAFSKCKSKHDWRLCFVGDGPDKQALSDLSKNLGIGDLVEFLGERQDVAELLSTSQIFAFPSRSEGFPNALAEGLAHGLACISYDCPCGPSELIEHRTNGILVGLDDEEGLAAGLEELMKSLILRNQIAGNSRTMITRFSHKAVLKEFRHLLHDTISNSL